LGFKRTQIWPFQRVSVWHTNSFCFFLTFWKNQIRPIPLRGFIQKIRWPLPCRGPRFENFLFFFVFWEKIRPIPRRGSISKRFSDHCHVDGHDLTNHILFVLWLFEKEIRAIPMRGSISKGFDDHYHVEGPDPKKKQWPLPRRWPQCDIRN